MFEVDAAEYSPIPMTDKTWKEIFSGSIVSPPNFWTVGTNFALVICHLTCRL